MADFAKCAGIALQFEGVDPDGKYTEEGSVPSKYGVTVQMARDACDLDTFDKDGDGRITAKDVERLTFDDAAMAYKRNYWDCWDLDNLEDNQKALLVLDAALNHGRKMGAKIVQKALIDLGFDNVVADGVYGPQTKKSIAEASTEEFVDAYFSARRRYYEALTAAYSDRKESLPLWLARLEELKSALNSL